MFAFLNSIVSPSDQCMCFWNNMNEWDKALKRRLVEVHGPRCTDKLVSYKVVNGKNGIAFSDDHNTGYARIEIMIRIPKVGTKTVSTGSMTIHFDPESAQIEGVSWNTIQEIRDQY